MGNTSNLKIFEKNSLESENLELLPLQVGQSIDNPGYTQKIVHVNSSNQVLSNE